jgi:putative NADH-flavin reductase
MHGLVLSLLVTINKWRDMVRIAVIGATGRTGRHVVEQALGRGHLVTGIARRPEAIAIEHRDLTMVSADVLVRESLVDALAGCEAVVSALGIGSSRAPTVVYSAGIANVLGAMAAASIERLSAISAAPVGPRAAQPFLERRIVMPILDRFFGATYADMRRMEALLADSQVDWVSLRPPRLIDKPATGAYRVDANAPPPRARSLRCADLASALLDVLEREDLQRHAAFVAN